MSFTIPEEPKMTDILDKLFAKKPKRDHADYTDEVLNAFLKHMGDEAYKKIKAEYERKVPHDKDDQSILITRGALLIIAHSFPCIFRMTVSSKDGEVAIFEWLNENIKNRPSYFGPQILHVFDDWDREADCADPEELRAHWREELFDWEFHIETNSYIFFNDEDDATRFKSTFIDSIVDEIIPTSRR